MCKCNVSPHSSTSSRTASTTNRPRRQRLGHRPTYPTPRTPTRRTDAMVPIMVGAPRSPLTIRSVRASMGNPPPRTGHRHECLVPRPFGPDAHHRHVRHRPIRRMHRRQARATSPATDHHHRLRTHHDQRAPDALRHPVGSRCSRRNHTRACTKPDRGRTPPGSPPPPVRKDTQRRLHLSTTPPQSLMRDPESSRRPTH